MNNPTTATTQASHKAPAARAIGWLGLIVMIAALAYAFLAGDFSAEGKRLMAMPWGVLTVVDAYIGLTLFSGWVYWREAGSWQAWLWVIAILLLGNVLTCMYVLIAASGAGGNPLRFWFGKQLSE